MLVSRSIHEAGHAVVALKLGLSVRFATILPLGSYVGCVEAIRQVTVLLWLSLAPHLFALGLLGDLAYQFSVLMVFRVGQDHAFGGD